MGMVGSLSEGAVGIHEGEILAFGRRIDAVAAEADPSSELCRP
jgi:hypothetical protein